jgi:putative PIN family toxin of toxin-antitoxin system
VPSGGDVRAVVDTNVLLSGLLWRGTPHTVVEKIRAGTLTLVSSPELLVDLADVIARTKFAAVLASSGIDPERLLAELRRLTEILDPPPLPTPISRDPDDDAVLALAVAAQADLIISGDADLLVLGAYAGIQSSTLSTRWLSLAANTRRPKD